MESSLRGRQRSRSKPRDDKPARRTGFGYRAYGLRIRSDLELPEFSRASVDNADVKIKWRSVAWPSPELAAGAILNLSADTQYLGWADVARFAIRGAREISIEPAPDAGEPLVRLPLLGPVMALLLYLRGHFVLHASAMAIGGRGAVFVGDRTAGKSTTAAALVAAGHRLLADDVVAIDVSERTAPRILPGFPQLKLDKNVAIPKIDELTTSLPPALPNFAKLQHRLVGGFPHTPVSPERVYILSRGKSAAETPLAPPQALAALMRFSYVTRFGPAVLDGPHAAAHFERCASLAGAARVFQLTVPDRIDRLGEMVRLVEGDFA
jgi:hypothetical protein